MFKLKPGDLVCYWGRYDRVYVYVQDNDTNNSWPVVRFLTHNFTRLQNIRVLQHSNHLTLFGKVFND